MNMNVTNNSLCYPPKPGPWFIFILSHLSLIFGLFGIPANILTLVVLRMDKSRTTTRFLLIVLAVQDLMLIFLCIPFYVINHYIDFFHIADLSVIRHGDSILLFFLQWTKMAESYTVVLVSADRFIAIRKPLEAARKCTVERVAKWLSLNILVTFLLKLPPLIFDFRRTYVPVGCKHLEVYAIFENEKWYGPVVVYYNKIFDQIVSFIIPVVLLIFLNVCLIRHVRQSITERKNYLLDATTLKVPSRRSTADHISIPETPDSQPRRVQAINKRSSSQRSITFTLIGVITVFVICELPATLNTIIFFYSKIMDVQFADLALAQYAYLFMVPLTIINCSFNFFIYVLTGRKFRRLCQRALRLLFLRIKRKCCPCLGSNDFFSHDETAYPNSAVTQGQAYRYSHSQLSSPGFLAATPQLVLRKLSRNSNCASTASAAGGYNSREVTPEAGGDAMRRM